MSNKPRFVGEKVRLGDVVSIEKAPAPEGDSVWLLNLDAVEKDTGRVLEKTYAQPSEIGNSTVPFSSDAVLYSKLRPNLNKVVLPDESGYATSEMLPLSVDGGVLDRGYAAAFLRSKTFVTYATASTAGAKMPRVNKKTVLDAKIAVPDLSVQAGRMHILTAIEGSISTAHEQIEKLDQLVKSRFVEMFGDPVEGAKWEFRSLSDLYEVKSSKRIYARDQTKSGVPFLRLADIGSLIDTGHQSSSLFISDERYSELEGNGQVPVAGDVLVTARGTLGRCYEIKHSDRFYFQDGMITWLATTDNSPLTSYLLAVFVNRHFNDVLNRNCSGTTVKYLSISDLANVRIPLPPFELQQEFADFAAQVDKSRFVAQQQIEKLRMLYDSLAQDYFGD